MCYLRVPYATPAEFIKAEPRRALSTCDDGYTQYECAGTRYLGECDFGDCTQPSTHRAIQPNEVRPVCLRHGQTLVQINNVELVAD